MKHPVTALVLLPLFVVAGEIHEQLSFSIPTNTIKNNTTYFNGDYFPSEPNAEAFPLIRRRIILPENVVDSSISVHFWSTSSQILSEIGTIERIGIESESPSCISMKPMQSNIYKTHIGKYRQFTILDIWISPLIRDSISQNIHATTNGTVSITYEETNSRSTIPPTDRDINRLKSMIDNVESLPQSRAVTQSINLAIITTSETQKNLTKFNSFIASKEALGFKTSLYTEKDWGGGSGETSADNLHKWLKGNYLSKKIDMILIIGDPTPATGDIAMKTAYAYSGGKTAATDFYFSDVTGNWDADGNGKFGETSDVAKLGGIDAVPDISVGRIPLYSKKYAEVDAILAKSIAYASAAKSSIGWRDNTLLIMDGYYGGEGGEVGEAIKNDLTSTGRKFYRMYNKNIGGCDEFSITEKGVVAAWTKNKYGVVSWLTHGKEDAALGIMNTTYAQQLSDEAPSFVYMGSCLNGKPDYPTNLAYTILKKGAVGVVSGSETTIFVQPMGNFKGSSYNHGMIHGFTLELTKTKPTIGDALSITKDKADMGCWKNYCAFNLYGDPTLSLNSSGTPVSIQSEPKQTSTISIAQNQTGISINSPLQQIESIQIYTVAGRIVDTYSECEIAKTIMIPITKYASGTYILQVKTDSETIVQKVSIK